MSTPSDTIRTQTAIRADPVAKRSIFFDAFGSSERISSGAFPVTRRTILA